MNNQFKYRPIAFAVLMAFPLIAGAGSVGGDVTQTSTNNGMVSNTTSDASVPTIGNTGEGSIILGTNASISIGATGAAASVSISSLNDVLPSPTSDGFALNNITQTVGNSGTVNNQDAKTVDSIEVYNPVDISMNGGSMGVGASTSVSATGAVASVSVSTVNDGDSPIAIVLPTLGNITQAGDVIVDAVEEYSSEYGSFIGAPLPKITNSGNVTNNGAISGIVNMGIGASASIGASGAVASFSTSAVSVELIELVDPMAVTAASFGSVNQGVQNTGIINNTGAITFADAETSAMLTAASVSVSATGAVAAVSQSFVNANLTGSWSIGDIVQGSDNTGSVTNVGTITGDSTDLGQAASAAVSATGAVASVSFSSVNSQIKLPVPADLEVFGVEQYVNNEGAISNSGKITSLDALGVGASASVSATGAAASVSFNGNNSTLTSSEIGVITQEVMNDAAVSNFGTLSTGYLDQGASVSVSATGAVASLSMSANGGSLEGLTAEFGDTTQTVRNWDAVTNTANTNSYSGITTENLGVGASASISATGAVAAISISGLNTVFADSVMLVGNYSQTVTNGGNSSGEITNGGTVDAGALNTGASASVSATGAVASLSVSSVSSGVLTSVKFSDVTGTIRQTVNNYASIDNTGVVTIDGNLSAGASVSVSASGAIASISMSALGGTVDSGAKLSDTVTQKAYNYASVSNTATNDIENDITYGVSIGDLAGNGASASISASGAVASTSFNFNNAIFGAEIYSKFSAINQDSINYGNLENAGVMTVGSLSGNGASASISASGAVASTSFSANNTDLSGSATGFVGAIHQTAYNYGDVENAGAMTVGSLSGSSASASISASGAVASTSYSTNASTISNSSLIFSGDIIQSAGNYVSVTNAGNLSVGTMSGTGASAAISATGAVSAFSVASVADIGLSSTALGGSFIQTAYNSGNVSNAGSISFSAPVTLARGASASISATGAATSVSFSSIK